jgi:hypothetical protein
LYADSGSNGGSGGSADRLGNEPVGAAGNPPEGDG